MKIINKGYIWLAISIGGGPVNTLNERTINKHIARMLCLVVLLTSFQTLIGCSTNESDVPIEEIEVTGEPNTFSLANEIYLNHRFVVADSIVIRGVDINLNSNVIFTEGIDYIVSEIDTIIRVTRLNGGIIPWEGTVQVGYFYTRML